MREYLPHLVSILLGGLIAYFIKTVSERKSLYQIITEALKTSNEEHVKVYHARKPSDMFKDAIKEASDLVEKEVAKQSKYFEDRLMERDIRIDEIRRSSADEITQIRGILSQLNESNQTVAIKMAEISGYFKSLTSPKPKEISNVGAK